MSGLVGKKNSTLKKESVKENKLLSTGVKSIKFWHEASEGETNIPFGSLVMPADVATNGFSNPTSTEILSANLALFHTNVEVHSSLNQKLMEGLTYVVHNNQIKFLNGYEATEAEVFVVVYKNDVITGTNVVDARPLTATGTLSANDTDFNVGEAFKTNAYPNDQMGEVMVFLDGEIQYRNTANATAGPSADGNYQEVHATNGFGTIIRFNESFVEDKPVIVISRNLIAERPDISMMQLIENLGGQLDSVLETVAALAGVDITEFQTAPNQVDLKAFGAQVTANKNQIEANTLAIAGKEDEFDIDWQIKTLSANIASGTSGTSADLSFSNLEIGKTYRVSGNIHQAQSGFVNIFFQIINGATVVQQGNSKDVTGQEEWMVGICSVFTATATDLDFTYVTNTGVIVGNGNRDRTFLVLEELPNHKETSKWA